MRMNTNKLISIEPLLAAYLAAEPSKTAGTVGLVETLKLSPLTGIAGTAKLALPKGVELDSLWRLSVGEGGEVILGYMLVEVSSMTEVIKGAGCADVEGVTMTNRAGGRSSKADSTVCKELPYSGREDREDFPKIVGVLVGMLKPVGLEVIGFTWPECPMLEDISGSRKYPLYKGNSVKVSIGNG